MQMQQDADHIVERAHIARGLEAEFDVTIVGGHAVNISCQWTPGVPPTLHGSAWRKYRQLRERTMRRVSERIGGAVATLEVTL